MKHSQPQVRRLSAADTAELPGLSALLIDAVHGGASVGFPAPLDRARADAYWREVVAGVGASSWLWIATQGTQVVGSGAEAFYARHGWQRVGEIPDYAASPAGVLQPTALYYKRM